MDKDELEEKKREFKERIEIELFVERYDTFKESVVLINEALKIIKIDYQFTYNEFCSEYIEECMNYMDKHPNIDMMDPKQLYFYTLPIIISLLEKTKIKYGINNE